MKKIIATLLSVVAVVLLLGGCSDGKNPLLGKWTTTIENITITREFKSDGTIIEKISDLPVRMEGVYTADDNKVIISMTLMFSEESGDSFPIEVNWDFSYSVKGNKLILIDLNLGGGEEVTYTKEKQ